jgi:hypothetical protein
MLKENNTVYITKNKYSHLKNSVDIDFYDVDITQNVKLFLRRFMGVAAELYLQSGDPRGWLKNFNTSVVVGEGNVDSSLKRIESMLIEHKINYKVY